MMGFTFTFTFVYLRYKLKLESLWVYFPKVWTEDYILRVQVTQPYFYLTWIDELQSITIVPSVQLSLSPSYSERPAKSIMLLKT